MDEQQFLPIRERLIILKREAEAKVKGAIEDFHRQTGLIVKSIDYSILEQMSQEGLTERVTITKCEFKVELASWRK